MNVWWLVWTLGVVLPVVEAVLSVRRRPQERWTWRFRGHQPWWTYVLAVGGLLCLMLAAARLDLSDGGYAITFLGGVLVSSAVVLLIGARHNSNVDTSR